MSFARRVSPADDRHSDRFNNVLLEKFCFAKRIWQEPFFYSYFISCFYFDCRDQRGLSRFSLLQLFEESFCFRVAHGFSQPNAWYLTWSVLCLHRRWYFFMHPALNPVNWN